MTAKNKELKRVALRMRDELNYSYPEIAHHLNISYGMVHYFLGPTPESYDPYEEKKRRIS